MALYHCALDLPSRCWDKVISSGSPRTIGCRAGRGMSMETNREQAMEQLRAQGLACTRCDLYKTGTQVVWGEGDVDATVMLIGQGPGETEDEEGRPFVGPAGEMLTSILAEAGIDRQRLWITNTIKHWATTMQRGRRVNRAPRVGEVRACRLWLEGELTIVQPKSLVCVGAPAAQAVPGKTVLITVRPPQ